KKLCKRGNEAGVFLAMTLLIRGPASSASSLAIGEGAPKEETLSRQDHGTNFNSFIPTLTRILPEVCRRAWKTSSWKMLFSLIEYPLPHTSTWQHIPARRRDVLPRNALSTDEGYMPGRWNA